MSAFRITGRDSMPPISSFGADSVLEPMHKRLRELGAVRPQPKRTAAARKKTQRRPKPPAQAPKPVEEPPIEKTTAPALIQEHQNLIHSISQSFFNMTPALAVDLFATEPRQTLQDTCSLGTQLWLETTFKQQVLSIDWEAFAPAQLDSLNELDAFISGRSSSRVVVTKLRQTEWFNAAFLPVLGEIANDMFHMYFRRDNQIRCNAETEQAWKEQDERFRNVKIPVNKLVPVLHPGDPDYDPADDDDESDSDSGESLGDAMDIDISKPHEYAFGH